MPNRSACPTASGVARKEQAAGLPVAVCVAIWVDIYALFAGLTLDGAMRGVMLSGNGAAPGRER